MLLHHYRFAPDATLFDAETFRRELAGTRSPIAPFKAALREIQHRLDERFHAGADIRDLGHGRVTSCSGGHGRCTTGPMTGWRCSQWAATAAASCIRTPTST